MSAVALRGRTRGRLWSALGAASRAIERAQGVPSWVILPALTGGAALLVAVTGFFWDVAYHIDHGRDPNLLTVPHVMILAGLAGLGATAIAGIALATVDGRGGWRAGRLRIPYFSLPLLALALGAGLGFPLDDLWHRTYGIDVTMWSPTHLLMIGGAVLSTLALALIPAEALPHARRRLPGWRRVTLSGAAVVGLSILTLEFDFGIPQWQALYHPLIVMASLTLTLTAARAALGRGGALAAALFMLLIRGGLGLLLTALGHSAPGYPLALGIAACVEVAFLVTRGRAPVATGLVAGGLAATAGFATEWAWQGATGRLPWSPALLPMLWVPAAGAVLAGLGGLAAGRVQSGRRPGIPAPLVLAALAGLAVLCAVPLPRTAAAGGATVTSAPVGSPRSTVDRFGAPATVQDVQVDVRLEGAASAHDADWFMVISWQGGGARDVRLAEIEPGHYRALGTVPAGGSWKSMLFLARGAQLSAVPVSFPPDPESRFAGYPVQAERHATFVPASRLMLTETHGGAGWVAAIAYGALGMVALLWALTLLAAYRAVARAAPA